MTPNNVIQLDGPKTLVLGPQDVATVLDALAERPFKQVSGLIQSITVQLIAQNPNPNMVHHPINPPNPPDPVPSPPGG